MPSLHLDVFDVPWTIDCPDRLTLELLAVDFDALRRRGEAARPSERLVVERDGAAGWELCRDTTRLHAADPYELVYYVEKTITIDTQRCRPDLFFLHAAAVEHDGAAVVLIAPSGAGKSTTTWALVNRGFGYLSDELAPIALDTLSVLPYSHALCLKRRPPSPFELPPSTLVTAHTLHVPARSIPRLCPHPLPLGAVLFNRYDPGAPQPRLEPVGAGEASALLYQNGLNALAHERAGLAAAARVAAAAPCYRLVTNDLEATCRLLRSTLGTDSVRSLCSR